MFLLSRESWARQWRAAPQCHQGSGHQGHGQQGPRHFPLNCGTFPTYFIYHIQKRWKYKYKRMREWTALCPFVRILNHSYLPTYIVSQYFFHDIRCIIYMTYRERQGSLRRWAKCTAYHRVKPSSWESVYTCWQRELSYGFSHSCCSNKWDSGRLLYFIHNI